MTELAPRSEMLYASSLDDHLSELAHHFGRGNNLEKLSNYLGRAARQSASRSALGEALAYARAGTRNRSSAGADR